MSLKITDTAGFKIGGILNPSITVIYVRANISTTKGKQKPIYDNDGNITHISIYTETNITIEGGTFDKSIQVDFINPLYWNKYNLETITMDAKFLEIETDLRAKLIEANPEWLGKIEIISIEN